MYVAGWPCTPTLATTMLQPVLLLLPCSFARYCCSYCHICLLLLPYQPTHKHA